jgi:hypothetical protein
MHTYVYKRHIHHVFKPACILEIFAEKRVSNQPDLLLIGQACRGAHPPPIFELVRDTLHHGDTIETRVWGPSIQKTHPPFFQTGLLCAHT